MVAESSLAVLEGAEQAAALLNPLRRRMVELLGEPGSAAGLARELDMPRQKVNYHLRELERDGVVEFVEERRKGNCVERVVRASARSYVISPAVLGPLAADPDDVQDRFSATYLIAVAARAIRELATLMRRAKKAKKKLPTLSLHSDVRFRSAGDQAAFGEELARAVARLTAKYHDDKAPGGRLFRVFVGAYPAMTRKE